MIDARAGYRAGAQRLRNVALTSENILAVCKQVTIFILYYIFLG